MAGDPVTAAAYPPVLRAAALARDFQCDQKALAVAERLPLHSPHVPQARSRLGARRPLLLACRERRAPQLHQASLRSVPQRQPACQDWPQAHAPSPQNLPPGLAAGFAQQSAAAQPQLAPSAVRRHRARWSALERRLPVW